MNNNINLISNQNVELEKELRRLKKFRLISLICLITVSLVSVLIFVLNLTLPLDSVKKEQATTAVSVVTFHKKLVMYTLITDRIKNISNILSQRGNYIPQIDEVLGKIPADVSVDELNVKTGAISVFVSSATLLSINKFMDDMVSFAEKGKVINDLIIQSFSLDAASGKYSLGLTANIP